jgi:hypothetical protein
MNKPKVVRDIVGALLAMLAFYALVIGAMCL